MRRLSKQQFSEIERNEDLCKYTRLDAVNNQVYFSDHEFSYQVLNSPTSPINDACIKGSIEKFQSLINRPRCDYDSHDLFGWTPLMHACQHGHLEIVKLLLNHGADSSNSVQRKSGLNFLHIICREGKLDILEYLIEKGCVNRDNIDAKTCDGRTALMYACMKYYPAVAKVLLANGASVDACTLYGMTPLHYACQFNTDVEIVRLLCENGAEVDRSDMLIIYGFGSTALMRACFHGNLEIANTLLEFGADPNFVPETTRKISPLLLALISQNPRVVESLIQRGANINQVFDMTTVGGIFDGNNLVHITEGRGYKVNLGEEIQDGTFNRTFGPTAITALMYACDNRQFDMVRMLLSYHPDVDLVLNGRTALTRCVEKCIKRGTLEVVKLLLDYERGITTIDYADEIANSGMTALMLACQNRSQVIVELLISYGADIDKVQRHLNKRTALMFACLNDHTNLVRYLLDMGANSAAVDGNGDKAIDLANSAELKNLIDSHVNWAPPVLK